ncbi:MAG: metallophosphoesterase family protein [Candidatus Binatia bacterium]
MKSYVIGDIHGCERELRYLIDSLPLAQGDRLVFLGDYIDRGPDSRGVVSFLVELPRQLSSIEFIFLKGNHEDMFLAFLGVGGAHADMFLINGGKATLASYGLETEKPSAQDVLSVLPFGHLTFYQHLRPFFMMEPFLCVHAGIDPEKSLTEQTEEELLWIRNKFIFASHRLPYTVLFGHTPQHTVFYDLPYKVGLDTGLVYGNMLTCLDVDEKVLYQISLGKKRVNRTPMQRKWNMSRSLS